MDCRGDEQLLEEVRVRRVGHNHLGFKARSQDLVAAQRLDRFCGTAQLMQRSSDACLRIGGPSTGADEMVALAKKAGKAVYHSLDEIPTAK